MKTERPSLSLMKGYHALPINIVNSSWIKFLYYKQYKKRKNENDPDNKAYRTLFVNNLSSTCTKEDLKNIFARCGTIEEIIMDIKDLNHFEGHSTDDQNIQLQKLAPSKGQASLKDTLKKEVKQSAPLKTGLAYVIFESEESITNALQNLDEMSCYGISENSSRGQSGIKKWMKQWKSDNLLDQETLEKSCKENITRYEKKQEEIRRLKERLSETQDDEGWTVVAKKGKKRSHGAMDTTVAATRLTQDKLLHLKQEHDKRSHKEDFYRFQKRENKEQKLLELQKKFEEDKKKIAKMRQARKFVP